jgi:hypothetical protein
MLRFSRGCRFRANDAQQAAGDVCSEQVPASGHPSGSFVVRRLGLTRLKWLVCGDDEKVGRTIRAATHHGVSKKCQAELSSPSVTCLRIFGV